MRTRHQRRLALALLLAIGSTTGVARAADSVNETLFGVAVHGYDVVAYFEQDQPVKGSREFRHDWRDASWHFASAESRDRFRADPERYAPQYGGYCAYAVAQGGKADIDPEAWKIVDGKLYLNLSKDVQALWEADVPGYIRKADANWPRLRDGG